MQCCIWVDDVQSVERFIIHVSMTCTMLMVERTGLHVILCNYHGTASLTNWLSANYFVPTVTAWSTIRMRTIGYEH